MRKTADNVNRLLGIVLILLMIVIVADVSWQVFTRFVLKNPSSFTEELAGFLLVWIGLLGSAYAFHSRAHLGIDILTSRWKGRKKRRLDVFVNGIVFLFSLSVLVGGGLRLVRLTYALGQISPALKIPMGYVYLVIPLSGLLFCFYALVFALEGWRNPSEGIRSGQTGRVEGGM